MAGRSSHIPAWATESFGHGCFCPTTPGAGPCPPQSSPPGRDPPSIVQGSLLPPGPGAGRGSPPVLRRPSAASGAPAPPLPGGRLRSTGTTDFGPAAGGQGQRQLPRAGQTPPRAPACPIPAPGAAAGREPGAVRPRPARPTGWTGSGSRPRLPPPAPGPGRAGNAALRRGETCGGASSDTAPHLVRGRARSQRGDKEAEIRAGRGGWAGGSSVCIIPPSRGTESEQDPKDGSGHGRGL